MSRGNATNLDDKSDRGLRIPVVQKCPGGKDDNLTLTGEGVGEEK